MFHTEGQALLIYTLFEILHVKSQKENGAKRVEFGALQKFCRVAKILQPAEFHRLRIFVTHFCV